MKKVGLLLNSLNGAGAQKTLLTLAKALVDEGALVDCYVVHHDKNDYTVDEGIGIYYLEGDDRESKSASLAAMTSAGNYNLFVTCQPEYYDAIKVENRYCSVHHTPSSWNERPFWRFLDQRKRMQRDRHYYQNKRLIALSEGIREDLINNLGCQSNNVIVINNPFDLEGIREKSRSKDQIPDYPYIIYVASLSARKRHRDLFRAFARIKDKNIRLLLAGKGSNERRLRKLAEKLSISDRVVFHGWDANPYRLVKNAKLAMLASEAEGLPRVVVESMTIGTPIVATDCRSGPREVLTGAFRPFLVPVGDVNAMARAMNLALEDYPVIPEDFVQRFDSANIARKYLELI